jgi:hypothetical protein
MLDSLKKRGYLKNLAIDGITLKCILQEFIWRVLIRFTYPRIGLRTADELFGHVNEYLGSIKCSEFLD